MCCAMPSFKFASLNFIILLMMLCFLPLIKSVEAANSTNSSEIQEIRDADKRRSIHYVKLITFGLFRLAVGYNAEF